MVIGLADGSSSGSQTQLQTDSVSWQVFYVPCLALGW